MIVLDAPAVIAAIAGVFAVFWSVQRLCVTNWISLVGVLAVQASICLAAPVFAVAVLAAAGHAPGGTALGIAMLAALVGAPSMCLNVVSGLALLSALGAREEETPPLHGAA